MELLLPASALEARSRCFMCGIEFPAHRSALFMRHVKACARSHHDSFEERIAETQKSYFTSSPDPELDAHLAAGGN